MDMQPEDRDALIYEHLQKFYTIDGTCWMKREPTKQRPKIYLNGKTPFLQNVLYERKYGAKEGLLKPCPKSPMCVNPDHATPPKPLRRKVTRHTDQCGGYDWAVVELVTQAGTVDVLSPDAVICDCDRAAIVLKAPTPSTAAQWLHANMTTIHRLTDLGKTLWPTLNPS